MPVTQKDLREQIVLDYNLSADSRFSKARLNRYINQAQRYIQTQLNGLGMKKWEKAQVITAGLTAAKLVSGVDNVKTVQIGATYLPDMLESPKSIRFIECNDGASYGKADEDTPDDFITNIKNSLMSPSIEEPKFMRLDNLIYLAPVGITAAIAHYYKAVSDLANDNDATEIPIEFTEYIIKKVGIEVDSILGKLNDKALAMKSLDKDLSDAYEKFLGKQNELNRVKVSNNTKLT